MKILVTNDDGIYARGLWALVDRLKEVGEVVVMAPDRQQSGVGTAVTLHQPLRVNKIRPLVAEVEAYSIEGTPADSVILALGTLTGIGMVLSGINEGPNLGNDVLISGTVGAALQGYFHRLPSMALSVGALEDAHFEAASKLAVQLANRIVANSLPQGLLFNINVPNLPLDEIEGVEITKLAERSYLDMIKEGHDGRRKYYWIVRGKPQWNFDEGTDIWALEKGRISITPLHSNLTSARGISLLKELCDSIFQELRSGKIGLPAI